MTTLVPTVRCFVPHAEAQVAFGAPGHVPARPIVQLASDLALVVGQLGTDNDVVLVDSAVSRSHLQRLRDAGLAAPRCLPTDLTRQVLPRSHPVREFAEISAQPWGWTPDTCALLRPLARHGAIVPTWSADRAKLWSKVWAAQCLARWREAGGADTVDELDVPQVVRSPGALADALEAAWNGGATTAVVKAPLASSGRGARRIGRDVGGLSAADSRWLARVFKSQGAVVLAPWRRRVMDVSIQLDTSAPQPVLGLTGLHCDPLGRYRGNAVAAPAVPPAVAARLKAAGAFVAEALRADGHHGPAGVDAFLYAPTLREDAKAPVSQSDPATWRLQPIVEVNARLTMGHVALALRRRVGAGVQAQLRVLGPRDLLSRSPAEVAAAWAETAPPRREDGLLVDGAVILNDPAVAQSSLAVLLVGAAIGQLATLLPTGRSW